MLKTRKEPTNYRAGTLVNLVDAIQKLIKLKHLDTYITSDKDENEFVPNPGVFSEMLKIMDELNKFDTTTIGDLYLTSGGRIVLAKGYGEYFNENDKVIYTLEELKSGIKHDDFIKRLLGIKEME